MIVDEVKIKVMSGKGGNGVVAFSKTKMTLGPTGGRGGNGGNVFFEGVSDLTALKRYNHLRENYAPDGKNGQGDNSTGSNGPDLILTVPVGSVLHNLTTKEDAEITSVGERILAAEGGIGGRGNFLFRSPKNTSPEYAEEGKPGEEFEYKIELRMIANVGLIGLPNAGKSSLLNEFTRANVKVANYPFTTLEPNLGVMGDLIIADIPGLIEGASEGRGLGIKFLKHIQRTKILAHCLSLESEDLKKDYKTIRQELENYDKQLGEKKEIIILTKTDIVSEKDLKKKITLMKKINPNIFTVSIHDWDALQKLSAGIIKALEE